MAVLKAVDYFQLPIPSKDFAWGSPFGVVDQWHTNPHRGTDLKAAAGTPISAIADGVVRVNTWSDCLGWYLVIEHKLRNPKNGTVFSGYNHMRASSTIKVGAAVKRGQVIGYVGSTGSCAFGAHLHLTMGRSVSSNVWDTVFDPRHFIETHDDPPKSSPTPAKTAVGAKYHLVTRGETLASIAAHYGYRSYAQLMPLNRQIHDPDVIHVGDKIRVK